MSGLHGFRVCLLLVVVPVQVRIMLFTSKSMSLIPRPWIILLQCIESETRIGICQYVHFEVEINLNSAKVYSLVHW